MRATTTFRRTIEATDENVITVRLKADRVGDFTQDFLLSADQHWDNPKCKRAMLRKHLDQAVERNALVGAFGDFFCAMQGKYDKRASKSSVRPEHQCDNYLDALVDTAADWMKPYAKHLLVVGYGNHETAIHKRHETDLIARMVKSLHKARCGAITHVGGYSGWIRILCQVGQVRSSVQVWYNHGWGGGGPVTVNTIQAGNRMPMMIEGADVIVTGHVHESWLLEKPVVRLSDAGKVEQKTRYIVQCPTYKDEYEKGLGGFHVETGKPVKPLGAHWMKVRWCNDRIKLTFERAD